jgi:hypothetical protein
MFLLLINFITVERLVIKLKWDTRGWLPQGRVKHVRGDGGSVVLLHELIGSAVG